MKPKVTSRGVLVLVAALAAIGLTATAVSVAGPANAATSYSLFAPTDRPAAVADPDTTSIELGVKFRSDIAGTVTGIRYYKSPTNTGQHFGSVWSPSGVRLNSTLGAGETASGWQTITLSAPVVVAAGATYTASYHATRGRYSANNDFFGVPYDRAPLHAPVNAGVYRYGTPIAYPTQTFRASNYWVDVIFVPSGTPSSSPTASPTGSPTASPTATGSPTPTVPPGSLPRDPWEGGPAYYAAYPAAQAWTDPNFFPIGVWFESVLSQADVDKDKAAGLNTYVELTSNTDRALVRSNGMWSIASGNGTENVGDLLGDEADMQYGPGYDDWTGQYGWNTCIPTQDQGGRCGYTVMQHELAASGIGNGHLKYMNYGKGVAMWETDTEAAQFVNGYTSAVSDDMYFYTDPNLYGGECANWLGIPQSQCRMSANYGAVVQDMRRLDSLDGTRQPIYGFVEDGHPFTESSAPTITGPQLQGAVMSSLIGGARGIIYFNHNFGGSCISQHVLRDSCGATIRPYVTAVNAQIKALAPILNTQSYVWDFGATTDTMLKRGPDGAWYVFAMQTRPGTSGTRTLTMPPNITGATIQVLNEGRTLTASGGQFTDTFAAEYAYHIYKIGP